MGKPILPSALHFFIFVFLYAYTLALLLISRDYNEYPTLQRYLHIILQLNLQYNPQNTYIFIYVVYYIKPNWASITKENYYTQQMIKRSSNANK